MGLSWLIMVRQRGWPPWKPSHFANRSTQPQVPQSLFLLTTQSQHKDLQLVLTSSNIFRGTRFSTWPFWSLKWAATSKRWFCCDFDGFWILPTWVLFSIGGVQTSRLQFCHMSHLGGPGIREASSESFFRENVAQSWRQFTLRGWPSGNVHSTQQSKTATVTCRSGVTWLPEKESSSTDPLTRSQGLYNWYISAVTLASRGKII